MCVRVCVEGEYELVTMRAVQSDALDDFFTLLLDWDSFAAWSCLDSLQGKVIVPYCVLLL